jgi:hypothetical protein
LSKLISSVVRSKSPKSNLNCARDRNGGARRARREQQRQDEEQQGQKRRASRQSNTTTGGTHDVECPLLHTTHSRNVC